MKNRKIWLLVFLTILLIIVITGILINKKISNMNNFMPTLSKMVTNYDLNIDNKGFDNLCTELLIKKYQIETEKIEFSDTLSSCSFNKHFEPDIFNRLLGLNLIIFKGTIKVQYGGKITIYYESYWIERNRKDKSKYVKGRKYRNLLNEDNLIYDIKNWKEE